MKPCSNRRKAIALLALDELDARDAGTLRSHFRSCEGCRQYFEEISVVTKRMTSVEMTYDVEASDAFHRKVMFRLRGKEAKSLWEIVRLVGKRIHWRLGLPVTAVLVIIIAIRVQVHVSNVAPKPIGRPAQIVAAADASAAVAPTLGNYQMAADQSLQKFDAFLNREATKTIPGGPVYRVSALTMADGAE